MTDDRPFNLSIDEVRLVMMFRKLEPDEREDVLNVLKMSREQLNLALATEALHRTPADTVAEYVPILREYAEEG